jgi:hypothetical protein
MMLALPATRTAVVVGGGGLGMGLWGDGDERFRLYQSYAQYPINSEQTKRYTIKGVFE